MAGSVGESDDNPVPLNVTAMVDIIFCLCIFFMCSFHFKQLQGKIEAWLPAEKGVHPNAIEKVVLEEIRVFLTIDTETKRTAMRLGAQPVASLDELTQLILASLDDHRKLGRDTREVPVIIDASFLVPWRDVLPVLDLCKVRELKIEFAAPLPS